MNDYNVTLPIRYATMNHHTMNYQKLILAGNATRDPELQKSRSGKVAYTRLRVGVSDKKDKPLYFSIAVFGKQAELVAQYVTKGREVLIEAHFETNDKGTMDVVADRVIFGATPDTTQPTGYIKAKRTSERLAQTD